MTHVDQMEIQSGETQSQGLRERFKKLARIIGAVGCSMLVISTAIGGAFAWDHHASHDLKKVGNDLNKGGDDKSLPDYLGIKWDSRGEKPLVQDCAEGEYTDGIGAEVSIASPENPNPGPGYLNPGPGPFYADGEYTDGIGPEVPVSVNGECGPANGVKMSSAPTSSRSLCSAGTPSWVVNVSFGFAWVCIGGNGGNASKLCSSPYAEGRASRQLGTHILPRYDELAFAVGADASPDAKIDIYYHPADFFKGHKSVPYLSADKSDGGILTQIHVPPGNHNSHYLAALNKHLFVSKEHYSQSLLYFKDAVDNYLTGDFSDRISFRHISNGTVGDAFVDVSRLGLVPESKTRPFDIECEFMNGQTQVCKIVPKINMSGPIAPARHMFSENGELNFKNYEGENKPVIRIGHVPNGFARIHLNLITGDDNEVIGARVSPFTKSDFAASDSALAYDSEPMCPNDSCPKSNANAPRLKVA